ncbi:MULTISPECIES: type II toxin-antitoxin system Phd/YefM family antitoxin [unclassified Variovorax]|uniref:type II toxin-antitoxin system Phd/YefM family antitoxin n=1 Tax=unclassified Variovorax TaxID=663243 RepID=UPI003F44881C
MKSWSVRNAKAQFNEMLDACRIEGPQALSNRGAVVAVLVPAGECEQLQARPKTSLKDLLLSEGARTEFLVPARGVACEGRAVGALKSARP